MVVLIMALKMKIRNKVLVLIAAVTLLVAAGVPDNTPQAAYVNMRKLLSVRCTGQAFLQV